MAGKHPNKREQPSVQSAKQSPKSSHPVAGTSERLRQKEKDASVRRADKAVTDEQVIAEGAAGQNRAIDSKRNDEQQYHAAGKPKDPHNRTQERVDNGDPEAGDVDEETRSESAPFNKTYGHHA